MGDEAPASSLSPLATKKRARGEAADSAGDLRRVAEIVMVLSSLGQMRGGRDPTPAEKALVAEAREKLASLCEGVRPKDLFSKEAVRVVVEDLGLNRSRDPMMGFRPTRLSISEKLLLTKRKMEESKELSTQTSTYGPNNFSLGFASNPEPHGTFLYGAHKYSHEKSSIMPPLGGLQSSNMTHGIMFASTKQTQTHAEVTNLRFDGRAQVRASSIDYIQQKSSTATSMQSAYGSTSSPIAKYSQTNKPLEYAQMKSEAKPEVSASHPSHQVTRNHEAKASVVQPITGNSVAALQPPPGLDSLNSASLVTDHNDIAKYVQRILYPTVPKNPSWIPPSMEYINKPLNCSVCKVIITDTESLLVCDSCEGGYHLRCLNPYGSKGIPKLEWHCQRCLTLSNGKPLPPKYGRVTRALSLTQKAAPVEGSHLPSDKKTENQDHKLNQQKVIVNKDSGTVQHSQSASIIDTHDRKGPNTRMREAGKLQGSGPVMGIKKDEAAKPLQPNDLDGAVHLFSGAHVESSSKDIKNEVLSFHDMKSASEAILQPQMVSDKVLSSHDMNSASEAILQPQMVSEKNSDKADAAAVRNPHESQTSLEYQNSEIPSSFETPADQMQEDSRPSISDPNEKVYSKEISELTNANSHRISDQENLKAALNGALDMQQENKDSSKSLQSGAEIVEWLGAIIQVVEEKANYISCCVNGALYRLHDHVLISSGNFKDIPAKLQSLWEDTTSGSKWATVSPYCLPSDLPDTVKQPSVAEINEVYATNDGRNILAHLIRGHCEVLPKDKFREESETKAQKGDNHNNGLHPIFMCEWIYDESACTFQSLSS